MSSGGYRPGSGRKKGSKDKKPRGTPKPPASDAEKIRQMLAMGTKAKARFYQEFMQRVARGEKLSVSEMRMMDKIGLEIAEVVGLGEGKPPVTMETIELEAPQYLRRVWNDPNIETVLRIRAAEIIVKGDGGEKGIKEKRNERAKTAGSGKFRASVPPLRVVK